MRIICAEKLQENEIGKQSDPNGAVLEAKKGKIL
jgi:hypothetical protein